MERLYPSLYLDTVPPWLQPSGELPVDVLQRIRPEAYQAPPAPDAVHLRELPAGPIVLVTLGTVFNRNVDLLGRLCRGARDAGAHVVCTVGPSRRASPGAIDGLPGVDVVDYVPLAEILPRCAAVVAHGGYNTVLAALLEGVPLMLVPLAADHAHTAGRCVELGVGLIETADMATDERVGEIVSILLRQPEYRDAAAGLAARTAELPTAATAVPVLEQLAADNKAPAQAR
jgi:MGT family glycosyltransferase